MRFTGKITTWHPERGFGFITPAEGGQDIFVHVSELPRGFAPTPEVSMTFEVALNPQGKKKAVRVQLAQAARAPGPRGRAASQPSASPRRLGGALVSLALVGLLGWAGYSRYVQPMRGTAPPAPPAPSAPQEPPRRAQAAGLPAPSATVYRCDGRLHCSQMTSCAEATWFLKNCPGTQMDGNGDGVPCEQQWCR